MQRATIILSLALTLAATAAAMPGPRVGEAFQIASDREMEEHGNRDDSGRSTSTDRGSYLERVTAVRSDGVVLEYDLPAKATSDDRASNWQFPFQVLKAPDGKLRLLNAPELSGRVDRWLKAVGMPKSACGKLIFTWNAFQIECDPEFYDPVASNCDPPRQAQSRKLLHGSRRSSAGNAAAGVSK